MSVKIYTDGACAGNPGPGGYCAILRCKENEKIVSGSNPQTTNNQMELIAVIEGLKALKKPCEVEIISDSKYVCDAINQHWLDSWKSNFWRKSDNKPVKNSNLWRELDKLIRVHTVKFTWIKGHAGNPINERCDQIAVQESLNRYIH